MDIDQLLHQHLLTHPMHPEEQVGDPTIIDHILQMPVYSPKQKFICLSSISNYHWLPYPESNGNHNHLINPKKHVGYNWHLLHKPTGSHSAPTSPRNRLMYYLTKNDSFVLGLLLKRYLQMDQDKIDIYSELSLPVEEIPIHPRKKRRHQNHLVTVTLKEISQETGEDYNYLLNCSNPNRSLYT